MVKFSNHINNVGGVFNTTITASLAEYGMTSIIQHNPKLVVGGYNFANSTLASGANETKTLTFTKSGYYPIGIVGYTVNYVSGANADINVYQMRLSGASEGSAEAQYSVKNLASASVTYRMSVTILWAKNIPTS